MPASVERGEALRLIPHHRREEIASGSCKVDRQERSYEVLGSGAGSLKALQSRGKLETMEMDTQFIELLSTRLELRGVQKKITSMLDELLKQQNIAPPPTAAEVRACFRKYEGARKIKLNLSELLMAMRDE